MVIHDIPPDIREKFEVHEWKHAVAILKYDFPQEWNDLIDALRALWIPEDWVRQPGGRKSRIAIWLDQFLSERGWVEKGFSTAIKVDGVEIDTPTHKVDCFKNGIAMELEWNNKDPFFDRDLNNFRLLFDLRAVSVGVILTRCDELQSFFNKIGKGESYGASTTHMSKLLPRIDGGGGAGCPILVFGIKSNCIIEE
ncbi:MAG: BglII/BstYI family type II restriction endonuclease [Thermoguttaceae bacterium]|nr:BglII/BstYI family type II restriction endonuclease [Thermoguttaceae bacterium]